MKWNTLVAVLLFLTCWAGAEERKLLILHTNDIHGYIESYEGGGLELLATLIEEYRSEYPGQVVLLDGGDTSLGTPLSGTFHGLPTAEIMASLKYDAVCLGNHEFNWGKDALRKLTDAMRTNVLCANLVTEDGSPDPYPGYTVIERNGVKIAVIGLITPDTYRRAPVEATRGWRFLPPAVALRKVLPTLPDVDLVLCLDHIGVEADQRLAAEVEDIDLIVGGHSHTPLFKEILVNHTPIVQAGCYGRYLGVLEILVDTDTNSLKVLDYQLKKATTAGAPEPRAHAVVERYGAELRPIFERRVATVEEAISKHPAANSYDTPLGNLISDVFRQQAGTDVAVYNRGGVRFDMKAGPLNVAEVFRLFPFDDSVTVLRATGKQLRTVLEQGTVAGEGPLSASGLSAVVQDGKLSKIQVHGKDLREDGIYTLATTGFLADGGDGMSALTSLERLRVLPYTRDVLLEFLKTHERLQAPPTGRLKIESAASSSKVESTR